MFLLLTLEVSDYCNINRNYIVLNVRISPDKFYNLPEFKTKKSASFGFGTKTNFAKK